MLRALCLAAGGLLACSPWRAESRLWAPYEDELLGHVAAHAVVVGEDAGALAMGPLCAALGAAPVVGLGEASHGVHELKVAELAIVRCMAERPGPLLVLFELSYAWVRELDGYVQGTAPAPRFTRGNLVETRELQALLEFLRAHNRGAAADERVRLGGVDIPCWGECIAEVEKYLGTVDPEHAAEAEAGFAPVRAPWSDGGVKARAALSAQRARLLARRERYEAVSGPEAFADAVHRLDLALADASHGLDAYPRAVSRDRVMADNVAWFRGRSRPGERVVLIAHSGHVAAAPQLLPNGRMAPPSMGEHLRRQLGADYVPVHLTFHAGTFLAHRAGRLGGEDVGFGHAVEVYAAPEATRGTLEGLLAGPRGVFLDLRQLPAAGPVATYFAEPQAVRQLGAGWRSRFARWPLQKLGWTRLVPAQAFDVVVQVPKATPLGQPQ